MSRPSRVRVIGPLEPYAIGFRRELSQQGYTAHSTSFQLQLMAHASRWLESRGHAVGEVVLLRGVLGDVEEKKLSRIVELQQLVITEIEARSGA